MPVYIYREKGEKYFRFYYYFDNPKERIRGSTRRTSKEAARKVAKQIFDDALAERDGNGPTRLQREAGQRELIEHVTPFLDSNEKDGKALKYVKCLKKHLSTIFKECGWRIIRDINRSAFESWRSRQTYHPKTLNEYTFSLSAFVNWLLAEGFISSNPIANLSKVPTKGAESRERRAFTLDEINRLQQVAGNRRAVYITAAYTGLRRGELQKLEWRDIDLQAGNPLVRARASTTKNGKAAYLPLHPNVVEALQTIRLASTGKHDRVFERMIPRMPRFYADLKAAGIPAEDPQGRKADFHSLRNTFATFLTLSGKPQREIMELMRHSDMRLTAKVYTDAGQLPLAQTVASLPGLPSLEPSGQNTEQESVGSRRNASKAVQPDSIDTIAQTPDSESFVKECRDLANCSDGARCRVRTCDPCRVKAVLYH